MRTSRIETLCDGIFAIVMTLLVSNLGVPVVTDEAELFNKLLAMWPKFLAYVISFVVLGVLWSFTIDCLTGSARVTGGSCG